MRRTTSFRSACHSVLVVTSVAVLLAARPVAHAATAGPNSPGTAVSNSSFGTTAWTNPGNAEASDNMFAVAAPGGSPTQYLEVTNFGFALPGTAIIDGISVAIERKSAAGTITDARVRIVKGGVIGTTDEAAPGAWPTSDTVANYGGASDLWGETWTPSDINGAGFGVVVSAMDDVDTAAVNFISISVTYTDCGNGIVEPGEQCDPPGSCCSATCQFESMGSPCPDDGDACTSDVCDSMGNCTHPQICTDRPISGAKLTLSISSSGKQKAAFVSKDPNLLFPVPASGNDPSGAGATVDLFSKNEGEASFNLPATNWTRNGSGTVYKFSNKLAPGGPSSVKITVIKKGKGIKLSGKATGLPLTGSQGSVGIRIRTGFERNCALFASSNSLIVKDEANKFQAKSATTTGLTDCSDASLSSPSGAFLNAF
jgi:hypothetical protein